MSKKSQSTYIQKQVSAEIWVMVMWSLQQVLCVGPMHSNKSFSSSLHRGVHSCQKFQVSLESPDRHSLLVTVVPLSHWLVLNTPKSFGVPTANNAEDYAGQLTGAVCPMDHSLKVWFRCCLAVRRKWGGAWMTCYCWWDTCSKSTGKSFAKKQWYTAPVSLLGKAAGHKSWSPKVPTQVLAENRCWCHGGVEIVIHPDMGIMKVCNAVLCESFFVSKQDVSCKLCVYDAFCKKPLAKQCPYTMVRRSEGLYSLDVVWVNWVDTDNFSSWNSSHTGSEIFQLSQYAYFLKTCPYLSRHWFLDVYCSGLFCSFKWVLCPLKACNPSSNTLYACVCELFVSH
jgi:hypothetical protein